MSEKVIVEELLASAHTLRGIITSVTNRDKVDATVLSDTISQYLNLGQNFVENADQLEDFTSVRHRIAYLYLIDSKDKILSCKNYCDSGLKIVQEGDALSVQELRKIAERLVILDMRIALLIYTLEGIDQ